MCGVEGVCALGERGEGRGCCEEEMAAEAVVGVDCVACLERDFLRGRGGWHGEVGAGGCCDVHCCGEFVCWCGMMR